MDERWEKALAWHDALPMGRRKVEYNATIRRVLERLQDVQSLEELQARYEAGLEWATAIAKEGFPDTPALWATELRARQILGLPGAPPSRA
jgi:hypothetical protein